MAELLQDQSYVLESVDKAHFRNYEVNDRHDIVETHYRLMRTNQTVEFVERMHRKYNFENPRALMTIREAYDKLETYVDSSDPDVGLPNNVHNLQTAEGMRADGLPDWMQLVGLIHDMVVYEYIFISVFFFNNYFKSLINVVG